MDSAAHFIEGNFDDAVVKPSTQMLLKSFDLKIEYFDTLVRLALLVGTISGIANCGRCSWDSFHGADLAASFTRTAGIVSRRL